MGSGCTAYTPPDLLLVLLASARRNARPWKPDTAGARARSGTLQASKHLSRAIWRNRGGHRRRSKTETKMTCMMLLSPRLMPFGIGIVPMAARCLTFDRQVAEVQIRMAVMNRFTARGIPVAVAPGQARPGKGNCGRQPICATAPHEIENALNIYAQLEAWQTQVAIADRRVTLPGQVRKLAERAAVEHCPVWTATGMNAVRTHIGTDEGRGCRLFPAAWSASPAEDPAPATGKAAWNLRRGTSRQGNRQNRSRPA